MTEFDKESIEINSRDYWFKIVEFLQQNWALIDKTDDTRTTVWFFGDTAGVFDVLYFPSLSEAEDALLRNDFKRFDEDKRAQEFIAKPQPPFRWREHPNGRIYSSGRFWR